MGKDFEEGTRLSPDSIAQAYLYLHNQDKSCWTQEVRLRLCADGAFRVIVRLKAHCCPISFFACRNAQLDVRPSKEKF